jgi:hypothetical protein
MGYAVALCRRCGKPKIFQPPAKTTGCPWCGKRFAPDAQAAYATLEDARSALSALSQGAVSANATVYSAPTLQKPAIKQPASLADRAVACANSLTSEKGDFGEEEFAARFGADWPKALKMLIREDLVYEVKAGRYKAL